MKSIIKTVAFFAALSTTASATIAIGVRQGLNGDNTNANAAWIYGEDSCNAVYINNRGDNPCGIQFTLDNGYTYFLENCGGGLSLANSDGSHNSDCHFDNDGGYQNLCDPDVVTSPSGWQKTIWGSEVEQVWVCG